MSGSLTQFGIGKETVYGTPVVATKFFEIVKEDFKGKYTRMQADALSSALVDRADRFAVANKGAAGTVELEPLTKGFAAWLRYMMGTVATTGPTETNAYTHVATMANLLSQAITVQVGRAQIDSTVKPWTYEGGKVTNFEFSNQVDSTLRARIGLDFEKESQPTSPTGAYALATNVQVTGAEVFSWQGGTISVGGSAYDVSDVTISVDNALNVDRFYINSAASKKEPIQDGKRKVTATIKVPYVDSSFWQKVSSATAAGTYASLQAKWVGLTLLGTTIFPSLTIDIPVFRFDEGGPTVDGPSMLEQTLTGVGLYDGTNSPVTLTYVSGDTTAL